MKSTRDQYIELLIERAKRRARRWEAVKRFTWAVIGLLPFVIPGLFFSFILFFGIGGGILFLQSRNDIKSRLSRLESNPPVVFRVPTNWPTNTLQIVDPSGPNYWTNEVVHGPGVWDTSTDKKP